MKNKLLNNLTTEERRIFEQCADGQDAENIDVDEALCNLILIEGEEGFLEERGLSEERKDVYNEVRRYINSLGDYELRKKAVIEKADKQYKGLQCDIDKFIQQGMNSEEIIEIIVPDENKFLDYLGVEFGFLDCELFRIINNKLNFYEEMQ